LESNFENPSDALKALRGFFCNKKETKGERLYSLLGHAGGRRIRTAFQITCKKKSTTFSVSDLPVQDLSTSQEVIQEK